MALRLSAIPLDGGAMTRSWVLIVLTASSVPVACMSRPVASVLSPDTAFRAEVRDVPCLDGPCQSIWLGPSDRPRKVIELGADADWCNTIVWSGDSSTAVFLVQDAKLVAVDSQTSRVITQTWLTGWRGEYPPDQRVIDLALSEDGSVATFSVCPRERRPGGECRPERRTVRPAG